jgi:hypothetical protein
MPTEDIEALIAAEPLDLRAVLEAVAILAGGAESMLVVLRHELERAPWPDADPDAPEGGVSRIATMTRVLEVAEGDTRSVRTSLGLIAQRLAGGAP